MPETCPDCSSDWVYLCDRLGTRLATVCQKCEYIETGKLMAELASLRAELATERNRATVALEWLANETSIPSDDMDKAAMLMDGAAEICAVCVQFTKADDMHEPYDGSDLGRCCTDCMDSHELWPQKEPDDA